MNDFTLDPQAAKAGSGGSSRIDTTGKYKGKIKFAKYWESDGGAKFVTINFEADTGQQCRLQICTHSGRDKGGQPTYGYKQIQAIMACLKVRALTQCEQVVDDYDQETNEVRPVKRQVFKEMTGAKLGLALYRHDKISQQGKDVFSMEIAAPFNYDSEQTAQEVLDQKPAETLGKIVASLKDKDSRAKTGNSSSYSYQQSDASYIDDSIPF